MLVVFADLSAAANSTIAGYADDKGKQQTIKVDLSRQYEASEAAKFLRARLQDQPARYFGYGPHLRDDKRRFHYSTSFADPETNALLASNWASSLGLQSIQGYDPIHVRSYDEYFDEINGLSQNYHDTDVFPSGLNSPLLDLLNVRYIVVPATVDPDQNVLQDLKTSHPTLYEGDRVDVLENRSALPRAWIVHSARQTTSKEALKLLRSGDVDPRDTALLEAPLPNLDDAGDNSGDRASVTNYEANEIDLRTSTRSPGLLVLSEVYYPAWKAYVDGEPSQIYRTDQLLRGIRIPEGEHTVELRYESPLLRAGMALSLIFYAALIATIIAAASLRRRNRRYGANHVQSQESS